MAKFKIYFEGLAIPKDCPMCPLAHYNKLDKFTGCEVVPGKRYAMNDFEYAESSERPEWCPLVEGKPQTERKPRKFNPPTREEVRAYVQSRNSTVDPDYFYDYFTTGEWIDSEGKQVRNWKQKLLTWEGRGDNGRKQHLANGQSSAETGKAKSKFVYDNA